MVSDHFHTATHELGEPWSMRPGTVHPPHLSEPLAAYRVHPEELEAEQLLPFIPNAVNIDQKKDKRLYSLAKIIAECASVQAAATANLR